MGAGDVACNREPSDLEIYNLYRDYIKHEDGLISARLGSFLTINTFLIAAAILISTTMLEALGELKSNSPKLLVICVVAVTAHTVIAWIGWDASKRAAVSVNAAMAAIGLLRDNGNDRLKAGIDRMNFPPMTNAKLLGASERELDDAGHHSMREIPKEMQTVWIVIGFIPWFILILVLASLWMGFTLESWPAQANGNEAQETAESSTQSNPTAAGELTKTP